MKQILCRTLLLILVVAAILGLSSCEVFVEPEASIFDLDVVKFERNVIYGSEIDISGLRIKVTAGKEVAYYPVTSDMITGIDTTTVGEHELIVKFGDQSWPLYYEVFYKIEHIVDGFVYDSQLVTSRDELMRVEDPKKEGYTFMGWDKKIPDELTDNIRLEAMFADVVVPDFAATYGDTLADLTLPEAKEGHWEWKDDLTTSVGKAGTNRFTLIYTPNNPAAEKLEFQVPVVVAKKQVKITIIQDKFEYDGNEHAVQYELSDGLTMGEVNLVCFGTEYATNAGSYYYRYYVSNKNYEGQVVGTLEITKPVWNVSIFLRDPVDSEYKTEIDIDYGSQFPEHITVVTDKDGNTIDLASIKFGTSVEKPGMLTAGYYEVISTLVDNDGDDFNDLLNYDIVYNIAKLVVNKIDFYPEGYEPGDEIIAEEDRGNMYYGDLLSSVDFVEHPNGKWVWDYDYVGGDTVGNAGYNTYKIEFIPDDTNYNIFEAFIVLHVEKQHLYFQVDPESQVVDYDGNEHGLSYIIVDANGNVMENLIVVNDVKVTNVNLDGDKAIPYIIHLQIEDANYVQAPDSSFELLINKIDPITDFETPLEVVWNDGLKLGGVALPNAKYSWVDDPETTLDKAGTYTFKAVYTPKDEVIEGDEDNYNIIEREMTVIVHLQATEIGGIDSEYDNWVYDGSVKELASIFGNLTTNTVIGYDRTVEYRLNGNVVTELVNADVYNIQVVVLATEQYAEASIDVQVTIYRADAKVENIGIGGDDKAWTYLEYDESVHAPYSTVNYGTVIYEYKLAGEDDSAYTTVLPTNAGSYVLRVRVEGGEGYNWNAAEPKTVNFTIKKAVVSLPEIASKSYTGDTLTADVAAHDLYKVKDGGNLGGIDVGKYEVVLVLNDDSNYEWNDVDFDAEATLIFEITQATNYIEEFEGGEWTYGDTVSHTGIKATFGEETVIIKYYLKGSNQEVAKVVNAGDYIVVATVEETPNYAMATRTVEFTVKKLEISVPTLIKEYEYTSDEIFARFENLEEKYYDVVEATEDNRAVGTYRVSLQLNDRNYMWDDGDENLTKSFEYRITKSLVTVTEASIEGWTYLEGANAPSADKDQKFGEFIYEYKPLGADDSEYKATVPTAAGDYVLRVSIKENANYDSISKTATFTIDKASASILGVNENLTYVTYYNTKSYTIPGVTSSHKESKIVYSIENAYGETVEEMVDAGIYKVTISLPESANYYAVEQPIEVIVVINKFVVNVPELESTSRVYNGKAFEPSVKENEHADYFTYEYPAEDHKYVGDYEVQFFLIDDNYEWSKTSFTGSLPYYIIKADASISIVTEGKDNLVKNEDGTYTLTLTYNGDEFDLKDLIGATRVGEAEVEYSTYKVTNVSDSGEITISVADSQNYNGTSVKVNVVINPADIAGAEVTLGTALTYNGEEQYQTVDSVKLGDDLYATYTVSNNAATDVVDENGNVKTYTLTVTGTGNFTGTATKTFTVAPMNIKNAIVTLGDDELVYNGEKQYKTVSSVTLEGFGEITYSVSNNEAIYAVDASGNVITYTLKVTGTGNFTGTETANFTVARRNISGAKVNLGTALTYTGKEQYQTVSSVKLGDLAATYTVTNNAATYVVDENGDVITYTLTVTGTGNFEGTATADFTVAPKSIAGATVNLGTALTYSGEEQYQTVSSVTMAGFSGITYSVSDNAAKYAIDELGNTEIYTLTVTGTGNFTGTTTKTFSVGKLELEKPQNNRQIKWTGEHLTLDLPKSGFYTIDDIGGIDEGDYEATLTITDINCKWKGESDSTLTITIDYVIAKEINHWATNPTISKNVWVWNEDAATINKGAAEQGEVTYKFALEGTTDYTTELPTKPGKYIVVFTATKEGYRDLTETKHFEIKKVTLVLPEFVDDTLDYANGEAPALELKAKDGLDVDKFEFTNNTEVNVGDYYIVFTIKDEYKDYYQWSEFDPASYSVHYSIMRVDEEITNLKINGWTYGEYDEDANKPTAGKKFDDSKFIFEYKLENESDDKYDETVPEYVGEYVVRARIVGGEGYNWNGTSATYKFSIKPADASISIETEGKDNLVKNEDGTYTLTLTYNGGEFDLKDLIGATRVGEADVKYSTYKVTNVSDSGKVIISVANSNNYNGTSVEVNVVINPMDIAGATVKLGTPLTYTGKEQTQTVSSVVIGDLNVTYTVSGNKATDVNANGYTLTVTGTGNFTGSVTKTFTVAPMNIKNAIVTLGDDELVYNGENQNQTVASVTLAGFSNVTYDIAEGSDLVVKNATDYAITVVGTGNFTGTVTKTFSVAPLDIKNAIITLGLGKAPIYNGVNQTQTITSIDVNGITLSEGDYSFAEGSTLTAKVVAKYSITVVGEGNFIGSKTESWSIETLYLDMPYYDQETEYTYDGVTEHIFFSETNTFWKATGDLSGVEGGTYSVTIVIKEEHKDNCAWKEDVSRVYEYTVKKGTNEFVGTLTMSGWTYEDEVISTPTGITGAKFGFDNIVYKYYDKNGKQLDTAPTSTSSVGTYTVYAYIPADGNNYDEITTQYVVSFEISPRAIPAPEINSIQDYVDGGNNYPTILGTTDVLVEGEHDYYKVTYVDVPGSLGLAEYKVTITLNNSNYVWEDGTKGALNLTYTLKGESAKLEVENTDGIIEGWSYGAAPEDMVAYVKAQLGLKVSISAGEVTDYNMYILYFKSNTDASEVGSKIMPTNAGTHYFKIVIEKDSRYEETTSEAFYQYTITPASLTAPTMEVRPATYGQTLGNLTIIDKVYLDEDKTIQIAGTWTWVDGNETSVGSVGEKTFKATFTPTDKNYAPIENVEVTVTVSAREIYLSNTANIISKPYITDGYGISDIFAFQFKIGQTALELKLGEDYTVKNQAGEVVSNFTAIDTYTVTVVLLNENYKFNTDSTTTYTFSVTKAPLKLEGAVENNTSALYLGDLNGKTADNFKTGLKLYNGTSEVEGLTINVAIYSDANCTVLVDSITTVGNYYIKYTLGASDTYEMDDVVRVVKVTPADPGVSVWPTYTGSNYKNLIDLTKVSDTGVAAVDGTFTMSSPTFNGSVATIKITFTPSDSNYGVVYGECTIDLIAVARYGSTEYYTIKDALDVANAAKSGIVWVYPDVSGNVVIDTNIRIASGVTLVFAYGKYTGTDDATIRNQGGTATLVNTPDYAIYTMAATYRQSIVKVLSGVTITVDAGGTLEISGELSGKSVGNCYAGSTGGKYSELMLGDDAVIDCSGTIKSYGFITEEHKDGGSRVEVRNGAILNQPFSLLDFKGGSYMYGIYNKMKNYNIAAFEEFIFMNVHPVVTYHYGAKLETWANLYAGDKQNYTLTQMIGNTSKYCIQMPAGGSVVSKFDKDTMVTDLDIYGGISINAMSLTVNTGISNVSISTVDVYFPISWAYDISLNRTEAQRVANEIAVFTVRQKLQLLPGSRVVVEEGAKLVVNNDNSALQIHDRYVTNDNSVQSYGDGSAISKRPAILIVRGELVAKTLAGRVCSDVDGAKVSMTGISSDVYRVDSVSGSSLLASATVSKRYTLTANFAYLDGDGNVLYATGRTATPSGQMYTHNGNWRHPDAITISYNSNGGYNPNTTTSAKYDPATGRYVLLSDPTREHYTFNGWYDGDVRVFDGVLDNPTSNVITLTANWTAVEYTVTFEYWYQSEDSALGADGMQSVTVTYTMDQYTNGQITLTPPANGNKVFAGWYNNSGCTTEDQIILKNILTLSDLRDNTYGTLQADGTHLVHCLYSDVAYTVIYQDEAGNEIGRAIVAKISASQYYWDMFEELYRNNIYSNKYIAYWSYNGQRVETFGDIEIGSATEFIVTATFETKEYTVNVSVNNGLSGNSLINQSVTIYLMADQISEDALAEYTALANSKNRDTSTSKYFTGWNVPLAPESFGDGKTLNISATWADKMVFKLVYDSYGNSDLGLVDTVWYLSPDGNDEIPVENVNIHNLLGADNTGKTYTKYFSEWNLNNATFSYNAESNTAIVNYDGINGAMATATAVWGNKLAVTINHYIDGKFDRTEIVYINFMLYEWYYDSKFDVNNMVTSEQYYFAGWSDEQDLTFSGNGINLAPKYDGGIMQMPVPSITANWETKYKLTISSGSNNKFSFSETLWLLESQINSSYLDEYMTIGKDNYVKKYDSNVDVSLYFGGWNSDIAIENFNANKELAITPNWTEKKAIVVSITQTTDSGTSNDTKVTYVVNFYDSTSDAPYDERKVTDQFESATMTYYLMPGYRFMFNVESGKSGHTLPTKLTTVTADGTYSYKIDSVDGTKSSSCITGDTLITLADGTQKRVDQLTGDELLLVWNLETGRYEAANIVFIDSEAETVCEIIHLYFSDGSEVKVISEHGFFDLDLAKYVYIDATNYSDFIGHRFVTEGDINGNTWNEVTLTNVVIEHKLEKAWSPVTFKQLCYYTNGVLSMPGGIEGLFNIFEVDTDTMTYDVEKMQADIETYGLFTLDDFGGMIPEIAFEAFNGAWLKVAIGKGMLTWEDIAYLAERYVPLV